MFPSYENDSIGVYVTFSEPNMLKYMFQRAIISKFFQRAPTESLRELSANKSKLPNHSQSLKLGEHESRNISLVQTWLWKIKLHGPLNHLVFLLVSMFKTVPCNLSNNGWKWGIAPNQRYGLSSFSQVVRCGDAAVTTFICPRLYLVRGVMFIVQECIFRINNHTWITSDVFLKQSIPHIFIVIN
jgi:hypothetical protein